MSTIVNRPVADAPVGADKDYQLAEYTRLCCEIEKRVELAIQFFDRLMSVAERCVALAGVFLTLAGVIVSVGSHAINAELIGLLLSLLCYAAAITLLCCPILLAFLAGLVGENDLRIGQINYHIKREHEALYLPRGWESIRHPLFRARPWQVKSEDQLQYHELASRKGLKLLSMRGLFAVVQILFISAAVSVAVLGTIQVPDAWHFPLVLFPSGVVVLVVLASFLTVVTWRTIEHRRHRGETKA